MVDLFECDESTSIVQTNAANAFNSLNRNVFLHNNKIICSEIAKFVFSCYTLPSRLFIRVGTEIKSQKGTTQGDPSAMDLYAIKMSPLLPKVISSNRGGITTNQFQQTAFVDTHLQK